MKSIIRRLNTNFSPNAALQRIIAAAIATTITFAIGSAPAFAANEGKHASSKTNVTFALDFIPDGLHAPIYVAQNRGYTGKTNLTIEPGGGSSLTIKLVSEGRAQIGIADAGSVSTAIAKGAKVKAVSLLLKYTPAVTIVSKDSSIKRISDLRGKSIGDFPESSTSILLPAVLKANGLAENDVKFVGMNFSARVPSLETKRVDAIDGYVQEFVSMPDTYRRIIWADNKFNVYGPVLIVNNDFAEKHGDQVRAVITGLRQGIKFTLANPKESAQIIAKASRGDAAYFEKEIEVLKPFFADPSSLKMTAVGWADVQNAMIQFGGQPAKVSDANLFTNKFIEAK